MTASETPRPATVPAVLSALDRVILVLAGTDAEHDDTAAEVAADLADRRRHGPPTEDREE